ncbi:hypothetical protein LCGC14_0734990 [marine sediment metagenome]|uniref:Uncharacterized protein n=1 Tax=marine sediment metagenome TaxID=412755 RepID=A0A0F9QCM9_9ZZZZ
MAVRTSPEDSLRNIIIRNAPGPRNNQNGDDDRGFDYSLPGLIGIPTPDGFGGFFFDYQRDPTFQLGGAGGGGGSPQFRPGELSLLQAQLAEQQRSAQAGEALSGRQLGIDRALGSLGAFNQQQQFGGGLLQQLMAVQQDPFSIVPALTAFGQGPGAGGVLAGAVDFASTGGQGRPAPPIFGELVDQLTRSLGSSSLAGLGGSDQNAALLQKLLSNTGGF